jgi:hypothetical protein
MQKRHPDIAAKFVGFAIIDHPCGAQLLACARKYFITADLFH